MTTPVWLIVIVAQAAFAADANQGVEDLTSGEAVVRNDAVTRLRKAGKAAVPALGECVKAHHDSALRRACLELLAETKNPAAYDAIRIVAGGDSEWAIRARAMENLATFNSSDTIKDLYLFATKDTHRLGRVTAIRQLSHVGREGVRDLLKQAYAVEKDLVVRLNICRELGRYGDTSGHGMAQTAISSVDWQIREAAADALTTTGDLSDVPLLQGRADETKEHPLVRRAAKRAIQEIRYSHLEEEQQLASLEASLEDSSSSVRNWAIIKLERHPDKRAREILRTVASRKGHPAAAAAGNALWSLESASDR